MDTLELSIQSNFLRLKGANLARDVRYNEVTMVRLGEMGALHPEVFSQEWPKPIAANLIATAATDASECIAPLPSLSCSSGAMRTDSDKKRAGKKNKIGRYYWDKSLLETHMFNGADWFVTYGALIFEVVPNFDKQMPIIMPVTPLGCYWQTDFYGEVKVFYQSWQERPSDLAVKFPELRSQILTPPNDHRVYANSNSAETQIEVVRYVDDNESIMYLPSRQNMILSRVPNLAGCCPIVVVQLPSLDKEARGRFDQVITPALALAKMRLLLMDAAEQSVHSPLVVGHDVNELPVGPGSVIRTSERVGRVPLGVDPAVWREADQLDQEVKVGARYPEGRLGQVQASVITGRGIQEMLGTFDTQIKTAQVLLARGLESATEKAFRMDVAAWPNVRKQICGISSGESFSFSYVPATDIRDDYACRVTYGFTAGLAPNAALVMMLQLRGDNLISRDTVRRSLPFDVDLDQEQTTINVDETRDALKQGLFSLFQAMPGLIQGGMDPMKIIHAAATVTSQLRNGIPIEDAMLEAFKPEPPPPGAQAPGAPPGAPGAPPDAGGGEPGMPLGVRDSGLPQGVAPGQAGLPPGGMPDIMSLVAGMRNGRPVGDATITRRIPV